jgi:PKD repeat protein
MKRIILVTLCLGLAVLPALARDDLVIGIDQATRARWEAIGDSFGERTGASVGFRTYPQASIAQQIVLQAFSKSGELNLVMVPASWATSLARYLGDLSEDVATLSAHGVSPIYVANRAVGVPLPFTSDWFLSILSWPDDRDLAVQFLVHAATSGTAATEGMTTPQADVSTFSRQKLPAADHNPLLDGALEALLGAARATSPSLSSPALASSTARSALAGLASQYGVPFSSSAGTITVVLESRPGQSTAATAAALSSLGVSRSAIETTSTLVKATVSLSQLSDLASRVSGVAFIRPPYTPFAMATSSQGVAAIGANPFHAAGFNGSGVKVAVIDLGFAGLSQAQANGDLPYSVQQNDLTGTGLATGITHGTAVAEIVHDVSPAAELHLIKIADEVDLDAAVTYCLSHGIDIINHSLGWYNTNFYDGTGTIADTARRAISGGILWVNAAGNEAESHWEGIFSDGPTSNLVASSTKYQTGTEEPTESIQVSAPMSGTYTIRVQGSGYKSLELFSLHQSVTPVVASSSILAPANVAEVIAVGAIDHASYTTGPQEPYSSRGPTNDGRTKPDLCAPDKASTGTSPYTTFYGTSGAAPHAAGAAALLLDQNPSLNESALRAHLLSQTIPMGSPNVYGNGRLVLQPPTSANQPPTAAFTFSPPGPVVGSSVVFNGSISTDADGSIVSYSWSFGDGASGSGSTVNHTYSAPGTYSVQLTVTDDDGATHTTSSPLSVTSPGNQAPVASFTVSPSSGAPGTPLAFNAASSYDPDGSIVAYQWDYGDGSFGSGVTSQHAYSSTGTFTVRLTVTDNRGASDTATRSVTVQSAGLPDLVVQSMVHSPASPMIGQNVTFTITVRNDGPATAGSFRVRLTGTSSSTQTYLTQLAAGASQTFALALPLTTSPETFTASADDLHQIVESNEANNTRSLTVTSDAVSLVADAGGPYAGIAGTPIAFDGSGSTGPITTYLWAFGDGSTAQGATASHTYPNPGTYPVTLTVFGQGGQQSTDSTQAVVSSVSQPLAAQLSVAKSSYQVGEAITVTFTTNRKAYVYLCDVSADNRVTLMLPNWLEPDNPLAAGTHVVPGSGYTLRITEPLGTETLYLFAATSPLPQFPTTFNAGFPLLSTNPSTFRNSVLNTMQSQLPSSEWAYDTLSFQVVSSGPATGTLRVETTPSGATVRIDGTHVGTSPVERPGLAPGLHSVQASRSGYQTATQSATVTAGTTTTVHITLTPIQSNNSPVADFVYTPPGPTAGTVVTFNASSSYDPDGSIVSFSWSFGDGGSASGPVVGHAFASTGSYNVRLTVTDNGGATDTSTRSVSVSSLGDAGWITPIAAIDASGSSEYDEEEPYDPKSHGWIHEERAHDDVIHTAATYFPPSRTWTSFISLETAEPVLSCDGIRVFVYDSYQSKDGIRWDIDVYRNGEWIDVFDGSIGQTEWEEIFFSPGTVTKMRLRAFVVPVTPDSVRIAVHIQEVDFHDATAPSP